MADGISVEQLKSMLRDEVEFFCRRHETPWGDISEVTETIRRHAWRAVLFGGTLRSLLISRLVHQRAGRPRDVDIVIQGPPLEVLRHLFDKLISRETRFGGLQLRRAGWLFDVWPLERTWALVEDKVDQPDFSDLPRTTFLNVEAVAVDVWPAPGREREIYSGDGQFFRAIIDRVVEVNRVENPFPELCVVRSLVMTNDLGFRIGPGLARYIAGHGPSLSCDELERIQKKHYGHVRIPGARLWDWIRAVCDSLEAGVEHGLRLFSAAELSTNRTPLPLAES
ncbi:hypothetical protein [Fimbriiglobus ruber]|uniref:Uncharacterized protein n=1 Tax=Fimbriiglobus ruber TaxID=1908690 RepID=A0A225DHT6_9BACT|nr:hypothetical protein [Fimbriiglobus ruber]OWK38098.1 hypothetical protein FRUB_07218 [Fimbriiglobus ruber]